MRPSRFEHGQADVDPRYREGDPRCACLGAGCDVCLARDYRDRRRADAAADRDDARHHNERGRG